MASQMRKEALRRTRLNGETYEMTKNYPNRTPGHPSDDAIGATSGQARRGATMATDRRGWGGPRAPQPPPSLTSYTQDGPSQQLTHARRPKMAVRARKTGNESSVGQTPQGPRPPHPSTPCHRPPLLLHFLPPAGATRPTRTRDRDRHQPGLELHISAARVRMGDTRRGRMARAHTGSPPSTASPSSSISPGYV